MALTEQQIIELQAENISLKNEAEKKAKAEQEAKEKAEKEAKEKAEKEKKDKEKAAIEAEALLAKENEAKTSVTKINTRLAEIDKLLKEGK